jgi:hypothetical protein
MRIGFNALILISVIALASCGSEPNGASATDAPTASASKSQGDNIASQQTPDRNASDQRNTGRQDPGSGNSGRNIAGGTRPPSQQGQGNRGAGASQSTSQGPASPSRNASADSNVPTATPIVPDELVSKMHTAQFAEFRSMCRPLFALRDEMKPLEYALAVGSATSDQVDTFNALESKSRDEVKKLNTYMWQDRWSADDRRTMSMIMYLPQGT